MILEKQRTPAGFSQGGFDRAEVVGHAVLVGNVGRPWLRELQAILDQFPVEPGGDPPRGDNPAVVAPAGGDEPDVVDLPLARGSRRVHQRPAKPVDRAFILIGRWVDAERIEDLQFVVTVEVEAAVALRDRRRHELGVDLSIAERRSRDGVVGMPGGGSDDERAVRDGPVARATTHARELQFPGFASVAEEQDGPGGRRGRQHVLRGPEVGRRGREAAERAVGEVGEPQPVVLEEVVLPRADVVADGLTDGGVDRWQGVGAESLEAEKLPDRAGRDGGQELAPRIGPAIIDGAGHVERAGRGHRERHVGVDGQVQFVVGVAGERRTKPVREPAGDRRDCLAVVAPLERRSTTARLVRDHHREPLVAGAGPDGGLAVSRVADHDHFRGIDFGQGDEPVEDPRQLPGPGGDRTGLIGGQITLQRPAE